MGLNLLLLFLFGTKKMLNYKVNCSNSNWTFPNFLLFHLFFLSFPPYFLSLCQSKLQQHPHFFVKTCFVSDIRQQSRKIKQINLNFTGCIKLLVCLLSGCSIVRFVCYNSVISCLLLCTPSDGWTKLSLCNSNK